MNKSDKFKGIIPAFYACYDDEGNVNEDRTKALARWLADKGVKGLYLCGSSGECIYQSVEERKKTLQWVVDELKDDDITIIAHIAANNTIDSCKLAQHAESLKVDAIASIPPIYFKLPEYSIADYWNKISQEAPNTDFIIYNIPQLAGVSLTKNLLIEMLKNKKVIGVKNSSAPVQDIQTFKDIGGKDFIVFNGPDEQYISGRVIGADGGIGGTYGVMPELFIEIDNLLDNKNLDKAKKIQFAVNSVINKLLECKGNLYASLKGVLKLQGINVGSVRSPLSQSYESDLPIIKRAYEMIEEAKKNFVA